MGRMLTVLAVLSSDGSTVENICSQSSAVLKRRVIFHGSSYYTWLALHCHCHEHCHGMSPSFQQAHHHPPEGSPFQHHNSTSVRPNVRQWQRNWRILWPATECRWSDTEGHSCCARRLECKSGQGCLWKLAGHVWTLQQRWHKWEGTQTSGVCLYTDPVLANTFGHHKASRRCIWHSLNGQRHNLNNYILVRKRFRSGMNSARTRSFPEVDIGSNHNLLITLGHCRNSWSVRQKERTEKEKIWAWRIWEIQGSEQQHQEVHEKG